MSEKLCPFCGKQKARIVYTKPDSNILTDDTGTHPRVRCDYCGAETTTYETEAKAIAAWNTRVEQPKCFFLDSNWCSPDECPTFAVCTEKQSPKCAEQPKAGEFTKLWRIPEQEVYTYNHKIINTLCDKLDAKDEEIRLLCSQEPCPKCGYGVTGACYGCEIKQLQAQLTAKNKKVQHTIDFCKVHVGVGQMSISLAADLTDLPYTEIRDWPEIDTDDCKTLGEAITKAERIVKEKQ